MRRLIPLLMIFAIRSATGQSLNLLKMQPWAIVPGQTTNLSVQVQAVGGPSRVTFESALQPGVETDMKDDGTGGDAVAGDSVYTIVLAAQPIVNAMQPDDVYRPFVGYVRIYKGATVLSK